MAFFQIFYINFPQPSFFVANRGHHADIGGIVPGSMPPHSVKLEQEGACIYSFKIVKDGVFNESGELRQYGQILYYQYFK